MRRVLVVNKHESFEQKVNLKIIYNQDCKRQFIVSLWRLLTTIVSDKFLISL